MNSAIQCFHFHYHMSLKFRVFGHASKFKRIFVAFFPVVQEIHSLHLTSEKISVELYKDVDSNKTDAQLVCHYQLDDDILYSINWYKDSREFYRFSPYTYPQSKEFKGNGVNVEVSSLE